MPLARSLLLYAYVLVALFGSVGTARAQETEAKSVISLRFGDDGMWAALRGSAHEWRSPKQAIIGRVDTDSILAEFDGVVAVAFSGDGQGVVTCSSSGNVVWYDLLAFEQERSVQLPLKMELEQGTAGPPAVDRLIADAVFSEKRDVVAYNISKHVINVWDLNKGQALFTNFDLEAAYGEESTYWAFGYLDIGGMADMRICCPAGLRLEDFRTRWDVALFAISDFRSKMQGYVPAPEAPSGVLETAISGDGRSVAILFGKAIGGNLFPKWLGDWNSSFATPRFEPIRFAEDELDRGLALKGGLEMSEDGELIAVALDGAAFQIRNGRTGELIKQITVPSGEVTCVGFGPVVDGKATCYAGPTVGSLYMWDLETYGRQTLLAE